MFRPPSKKRKRPRVGVTTTRDDDDESPDETTVVTKQHKKKKKASVVIRSFQDEHDGKVKKKRKGRGAMGYGGFTAQSTLNNNNDEHRNKNAIIDSSHHYESNEPSMYGKDALERLKSEQRFKKEPKVDISVSDTAGDNMNQSSQDEATSTNGDALGAFVPLRKNVILTGEEAAKMEELQESSAVDNTVTGTITSLVDPTEDAWEAQVARRAGVVSSSTTTATTTSTSSLSGLRQQVQSTLTQLHHQRDDLQSARARRQVEVQQQESEHARHQAELNDAGTALEFYQSLRSDLALWVGALRELQTRVTPLQQALRELKQDTSTVQRWRQQQDDVVGILREAQVLDRVLGRQPETIQESVVTVDEFGRDVKSRHVLERETRARQRRRIREQRAGGKETDSDALVSQGEEEQARERRTALREALHVAMNELDDEYTDLSNLIAVFDKWARTYTEEYQQCFANMSLADLANVLVQVDLCSKYHPLHWLDDQKQVVNLPWMDALKSMATGNSKEEETPLYRVVEMILIPSVVELLDEGAYDILSSKQSRSLAAFLHQLSCVFPKDHPLAAKMKERISNFVQSSLESISLPILLPGALAREQTEEDLKEATEYSTTGQLFRLEKCLTNLLKYWVSLEAVAAPILDFMSSKYLFLLSSLKRELAGPAFRGVWKELQPTGWLDRPDLFVSAAPIRAAASVYAPSSE